MSDTIVVKVGGGILLDVDEMRALTAGIVSLSLQHSVIIVHGGGPQATAMAERLGHRPAVVNGRRVTSDLDLEIILATVCGIASSKLVAALTAAGVKAVGLNGASAGLVTASKRPPWTIDGTVVDFEHVGDIQEVDVRPVSALMSDGFVPVIGSVGVTSGGALLNVNADTAAAAIAEACEADKLLLVTSSGGLIRDGRLVEQCDKSLIESGISDGWITDGMQVKLQTAMKAAESGIKHVAVIGPTNIRMHGAGTTVVPNGKSVGESFDAAGLLKTLIRFPSLTGSEKDIGDFVEEWAARMGLETGRLDDNVYCWVGDGEECLMLNSHLDVVPPSADHPFDPFDPVEQGGYIYGRGAVDAKASGAAMLATIAALKAEGWNPDGGKLLVALTACEEGTGEYNGLEALLPNLPPIAGAIVGEPTSLTPCTSQKGLLILKAAAAGRAAHAARAHLGENAIESAARDIARLSGIALDRVHPDLGPTTFAVTTISGGSARNVIPDECVFCIDIRTTPAYTHEEIVEQLQCSLESKLSIHSGRYAPKSTPADSRVARVVLETLSDSEPFGSPTVSDWAFLGDIPTVKLGPGDSRLSHTGKERISVGELSEAVETYSAIVRAFFGRSQHGTRVLEASNQPYRHPK